MGVVFSLARDETVQLDQARLSVLYYKLGEEGADRAIGRASRELAARTARCRSLWEAGDRAGLRKCARSMIPIAEQAGMSQFARVAAQVSATAAGHDAVALAATVSRLLRVGESSLRAVRRVRGVMV